MQQVVVDAKAGDDTAIVIASIGMGLMICLFALGIYVVVALKRKIARLSERSDAVASRTSVKQVV